MAVGTDQRHGAVIEQRWRPAGIERLERRLHIGLERDQSTEDIVGEVDHSTRRAEVRRQPYVVGSHLIGRTEILRDVGTPEPVDRLLGVADDEQPPRQRTQIAPCRTGRSRRGQRGRMIGCLQHRLGRIVGIGGEPDGDFELDRVGVLELVEEHALVALVEQAAHVGVLGEEPPRQDQKIVELELSRRGTFGGGVEHEPTKDGPQEDSSMSFDTFEQFVRESTQFDLVGTKCFQRPVAARAERRLPLALRSRQGLEGVPVAAFRIERSDRFEPCPQTLALEPGSECHHFGHGVDLLVVGGQRGGRDRVSQCGDGGGIEPKWPRIGQVDSVTHEIPVRSEVFGDPTGALVDSEPVELAEFDERPASCDPSAIGVGVVEKAVEKVVPLLFECKATLEFVEHYETGRESGFDREVEEDASRKRVQRADRCVVEPCERRIGCRARLGFESLAGSAAQL